MRGIAENVAAVHHHDMQRGGGVEVTKDAVPRPQ